MFKGPKDATKFTSDMLIVTHRLSKLCKRGAPLPVSVCQSKGSISKALDQKIVQDEKSTFKQTAFINSTERNEG